MGKSVSWILIWLLLPGILHANGIRTKVDENGRTVYYNIPTKVSTPQRVYYSPKADDYIDIIREICGRHAVDSDLVKALIQVESNYQVRAVSPKGAMGLMQLMPATAARYGVRSAFDPLENIEGGVKYLRDLLQLFRSDLELVLAAYNAGENAVKKYNGIPNYLETRNYVRKVMALYKGDTSYTPQATGPRAVTYYKYVDQNGVTHYKDFPVSGTQSVKVSFYY
jgi:hypothetical protein